MHFSLLPILLAALTVISTLLGGFVALRYRDRPHLILGFTAGILLGLVAFDLLPEIIEQIVDLNISSTWPMVGLVVGFLGFHIVEKLVLIHTDQEESYGQHKHPSVGKLSALALIGHSLMDGAAIGLAFQVGTEVGILVTIAVIAHDFSDGLNTVTLLLNHHNSKREAYFFLGLDALAPILGAALSMFFVIPDNYLTIYLGVFAGFLLYIGASEILPEAHSQKSSYWTIILTLLGALFMFAVAHYAHAAH